jgi:hypothetical protein
MYKAIKDKELVENINISVGGVFSIADLASLFNEPHKTELYRRIARLEEIKVLKRFTRGLYYTQNYQTETLCQRISASSYISFGNILANELVIGTKPLYQIDAVKLGRTKIYSNNDMTIRQFGCSKHLFFGFENINGIQKAVLEKAFLDTLYFHQHGAKFYFDIYSDIDVTKLKKDIIINMVQKYKNPKFVNFVLGFFK